MVMHELFSFSLKPFFVVLTVRSSCLVSISQYSELDFEEVRLFDQSPTPK